MSRQKVGTCRLSEAWVRPRSRAKALSQSASHDVRDRVESLLVDGQKVTVGGILLLAMTVPSVDAVTKLKLLRHDFARLAFGAEGIVLYCCLAVEFASGSQGIG
jgi:hypothetical protein